MHLILIYSACDFNLASVINNMLIYQTTHMKDIFIDFHYWQQTLFHS